MSRVKRLIQSYGRHIAVPWRDDVAAPQRVIFCVYPETDELRLRAAIDEFELTTRQAGHDWRVFDLTDSFAHWLTAQRYARSYFQQPHLLKTLLPRYLTYIEDEFTAFLAALPAETTGETTGESRAESRVVAIQGVASLFGFVKVKEVVDKLAPKVKGRLLVFFPGSYENNNYRLLDGYDGWNYLAVPITADQE